MVVDFLNQYNIRFCPTLVFLEYKVHIWKGTCHLSMRRSGRKCLCPFWLPLRTTLILYKIVDPQLVWSAVTCSRNASRCCRKELQANGLAGVSWRQRHRNLRCKAQNHSKKARGVDKYKTVQGGTLRLAKPASLTHDAGGESRCGRGPLTLVRDVDPQPWPLRQTPRKHDDILLRIIGVRRRKQAGHVLPYHHALK